MILNSVRINCLLHFLLSISEFGVSYWAWNPESLNAPKYIKDKHLKKNMLKAYTAQANCL